MLTFYLKKFSSTILINNLKIYTGFWGFGSRQAPRMVIIFALMRHGAGAATQTGTGTNEVKSPLIIAAAQHRPATVISALLSADPLAARAIDETGCTALHAFLSASPGDDMLPVADLLLAAWPEAASTKDKQERTPLLAVVLAAVSHRGSPWMGGADAL